MLCQQNFDCLDIKLIAITVVMDYDKRMKIAKSRITSQGQISVPAVVRKKLGLAPGSTIDWEEDEDNGSISVKRSGTYSFEDIRRELFKNRPRPETKTLEELKEGIGDYMRGRYGKR